MAGLVPAISMRDAPCLSKRDGRDKPGHDEPRESLQENRRCLAPAQFLQRLGLEADEVRLDLADADQHALLDREFVLPREGEDRLLRRELASGFARGDEVRRRMGEGRGLGQEAQRFAAPFDEPPMMPEADPQRPARACAATRSRPWDGTSRAAATAPRCSRRAKRASAPCRRRSDRGCLPACWSRTRSRRTCRETATAARRCRVRRRRPGSARVAAPGRGYGSRSAAGCKSRRHRALWRTSWCAPAPIAEKTSIRLPRFAVLRAGRVRRAG